MRKSARKTPRPTGSPVPVRSCNAFRVAVRTICAATVLLPASAASSTRSPDDDDLLSGSVAMTAVSQSPVSVTGGSSRPTTATLSPSLLLFSGVRDVQTSSRPQPFMQTNRSTNKERKRNATKTKKPKNKRKGKKKKTVLKNKVMVKLESKPEVEDLPPPSSSPPTTATVQWVPKFVVETFPRCAVNGGFVDVFGIVRSFAFQLTVAIVFALLVVVFAICRCWTSWTKRFIPFHVLP